jgi:hypothetical protein
MRMASLLNSSPMRPVDCITTPDCITAPSSVTVSAPLPVNTVEDMIVAPVTLTAGANELDATLPLNVTPDAKASAALEAVRDVVDATDPEPLKISEALVPTDTELANTVLPAVTPTVNDPELESDPRM